MKIENKGEYLYVVSDFEESTKNFGKGFSILKKTCEKNNLTKVLIDITRLKTKMSIMELFDFGVNFKNINLTPGLKIAVLCTETQFANYQFLENVVLNRFIVDGKVFTDLEKARKWLLSE